jgi:uncharacterized protein (TIGR03382 family)
VQVHALGALESFGQAYARDPSFSYRAMPVYQALLGDPTLRLFYPRQLTSLVAQPGMSGVQLTWPVNASGDFVGYHVFRRETSSGVAVRLTAWPVSGETFVDTTALPATTYEWRVVTVVRETTGSGTFWNHSLGARAVETTLAVVDAGVDAGGVDAGGVDAGDVDAGDVDAGDVDAGDVDAGDVDAGAVDAGGVDAGGVDAGDVDAGDADAGFTPLPLEPDAATGGCGCAGAGDLMPLLLLVGLISRRRKQP